MAKNLFSLFDEKLKHADDLVASPPQSLDSLSTNTEEQEFFLKQIKQFEETKFKVDYSDFSNFVFFNSALDYFNLTGEKILNEYPYAGTVADVQAFRDDLDDYQRYVLDTWPKRSGYLNFANVVGSYVEVVPNANFEGAPQPRLDIGTGSLSIEMWMSLPALTGSNDRTVIVSKMATTGSGYVVWASGTNINVCLLSGSNGSISAPALTCPFVPDQNTYWCFVWNRADSTNVTVSAMSGTQTVAPKFITTSGTITAAQVFNSSSFLLGSGSVRWSSYFATTNNVPFKGAVDEVRVWNTALGESDVARDYNTSIFAQKNLVARWSFNETGSFLNNSVKNSIVIDSAGSRLNGTIKNYGAAIRVSGSLVSYDTPDLILAVDAPEIQQLVYQQQTSASSYDRSNDNLITRMLPAQFFELESYSETNVLRNFVYVLGRHFDRIKVSIDQFTKVLSVNYGDFDQTPDALLEDVGRYFGWEFTGNFLSADAFQYLLGKNVLPGNQELDKKLYDIKNEFWRRVLINLMHLYKTKGTREGVESLLRLYGVDGSFARLKEYGLRPDSGIETHRIYAEKTVTAPAFGVGANTGSLTTSGSFTTCPLAVELNVRFPAPTSTELPLNTAISTIWTFATSSAGGIVDAITGSVPRLDYQRAAGSSTGTLLLVGTSSTFSASAPIFDGNWYHITVNIINASSSFYFQVDRLDDDDNVLHVLSGTSPSNYVTVSRGTKYARIGGASSSFWANEFRVWSKNLDSSEIDAHVLNFQSYATSDPTGSADKLDLHWRMDYSEQISADPSTGERKHFYPGIGKNVVNGTGRGLTSSGSFLFPYKYIAPVDQGWNEEKIRSFSSTRVSPRDAFIDDRDIALEFNLVDALNEDISQMFTAMSKFNEHIGAPANRYRATYPDLAVLRKQYFSRLQGRLNFRVFADMLEFFDHSFIDMVKRMIPARANFRGSEFVVESHMLERPKYQWNYRRHDLVFQPEGRIKIVLRD